MARTLTFFLFIILSLALTGSARGQEVQKAFQWCPTEGLVSPDGCTCMIHPEVDRVWLMDVQGTLSPCDVDGKPYGLPTPTPTATVVTVPTITSTPVVVVILPEPRATSLPDVSPPGSFRTEREKGIRFIAKWTLIIHLILLAGFIWNKLFNEEQKP